MEALEHLNNVIANKSAFVPQDLVPAIVGAARQLGIILCGGLYDEETHMRVLYVAQNPGQWRQIGS